MSVKSAHLYTCHPYHSDYTDNDAHWSAGHSDESIMGLIRPNDFSLPTFA